MGNQPTHHPMGNQLTPQWGPTHHQGDYGWFGKRSIWKNHHSSNLSSYLIPKFVSSYISSEGHVTAPINHLAPINDPLLVSFSQAENIFMFNIYVMKWHTPTPHRPHSADLRGRRTPLPLHPLPAQQHSGGLPLASMNHFMVQIDNHPSATTSSNAYVIKGSDLGPLLIFSTHLLLVKSSCNMTCPSISSLTIQASSLKLPLITPTPVLTQYLVFSSF